MEAHVTTAVMLNECRGPLVHILGVPVDATDLSRAVDTILRWGEQGKARAVFLRDVHGVMRSVQIPELMQMHEKADLVLADGTPLTWISRLRGIKVGRVPGTDLIDAVCHASAGTGLTHYFFGGAPGVAAQMADILQAKYPGLSIAGHYSPPMRDLAPGALLSNEERAEVKQIAAVGADFIWVGISTPKQETWITQATQLLPHGVCCGVGAAFDFHTGRIKRAPRWMQRSGLEWCHRLLMDPKRLWRRYLLLAPKFVLLSTIEEISRVLPRNAATRKSSNIAS
jgi:N-acetylglucosaminyldiphosphoundecaprenol N-acetyl-beta-D-mannosaminyltransferase